MKKIFGVIAIAIASLLPLPASAGVSCTVPNVFVNGTIADANQVDANFNAVLACLLNAAINGVNTDITQLTALTTPITNVQGGTTQYIGGTSTGPANAQVVATLVPSTGYTLLQGNGAIFIAGASNTGAMTAAIGGTAATAVFRQTPNGPQALTGGEVQIGQLIWIVYDGTQYEMLSNGPQFGGFGPLVSIASAATTDLGTVPTHNVLITGGATITSFGSTASTTYPIYRMQFGSAGGVLTNNNTSLIIPGGANITIAANDTAMALYLGSGNWQIVEYFKSNGAAIVNPVPLCGFSALTVQPVSTVTVTFAYNSASLLNPAGNVPIFNNAASVTVNGTNIGVVNGLDASALAANTFYYLWGISNGTTFGGILTANTPPNGPAMPATYTYKCFAGAVKTGGASTFFGTFQAGNETRYLLGGLLNTTLPLIDSGVKGAACAGAATYATETVRGNAGAAVWMPATAVAGDFILTSATGTANLSPNASYTSTTNFAMQWSAANGAMNGRLLFETNNVFYCSTNAAGQVNAYGWKDAVNAN